MAGAITQLASATAAKSPIGNMMGAVTGNGNPLSNAVAAMTPKPNVAPTAFDSLPAASPTLAAIPTPPPAAPANDRKLAYRSGIQEIESGGRYDTVGVDTHGDRPYGAYQIMGANIPSWTKEALGKALTPQQFLNDPAAQDATFDHKFGQYVDKYGEGPAAQAWLGGEGSIGKTDRKDALGTSVGEYGQRFLANINNGVSVTPQYGDGSTWLGGSPPATGASPAGTDTAAAPPAKQSTMDRVLAAAMRPTSQQPAAAQDPNAVAPAVDTGAEELAGVQQSLIQRAATPDQRAALRKQRLTQSTRGQRA